MQHTTRISSIDGKEYNYVGNNKIGWRAGTEASYYSCEYTSGATCDYFLTDGKSVLRCTDIMIWETDEGMDWLFDEWLDMIAQGIEGYSKVA